MPGKLSPALVFFGHSDILPAPAPTDGRITIMQNSSNKFGSAVQKDGTTSIPNKGG